MKTYKIFESISTTGDWLSRIAVAESIIGTINDDDPDETYEIEAEDFFHMSDKVVEVVEVGEITIDGDIDLLPEHFSLYCDCS